MYKLAIGVILVICVSTMAFASKQEASGAISKEVIATYTPSHTKVLVLPMWDYTSDVSHQQVATAAIYEQFVHEGFAVENILTGFDLAQKDKDIEPGRPLRKADALRIGKAAGLDWVVYGEVKELRVYEKKKLIGSGKKILCSLRLCVADCHVDDVIFWANRSDALGDTLSRRKSSKLIRVGLQSVSERILSELFDALPKHEAKGPVPNDQTLLDLEKSTWPDATTDEQQ